MPTSQALTTAVVEFERAIERIAVEMARSIVQRELQRRLDEQRDRSPALVSHANRPTASAIASPGVASASLPVSSKSRRGWTREAVVQELSAFLRTKFVVDGAFIGRHGPPGLLTAAKKHFGRLDAALNVASLAVAKQAPPPDEVSDAS